MKNEIPRDVLIEFAIYLTCMICGTVLVALGKDEFKGPLFGLITVAVARGTHSALPPRRRSGEDGAPAPALPPADDWTRGPNSGEHKLP